jgi:hypothetical protein
VSCGNKAGMGRAARNSDAVDTALRVKRRGRGEASYLGAVAWAGEGRRPRPASSTGGPWRGQPTSGIGLRWSGQLSSLRHSRYHSSTLTSGSNGGTSMGRVCELLGQEFITS